MKATKKTTTAKKNAKKTAKQKKPKACKLQAEDIAEHENAEHESEELSQAAASTNQSFEYNVDTSFFYTSDKFINALDNEAIISQIQKKYPDLSDKSTDSVIKKNIVKFLDDEQFVESVLEFYNLTIFDLFKLFYKLYGAVFKGMYLVKIRKVISDKKYASVPARRKHK